MIDLDFDDYSNDMIKYYLRCKNNLASLLNESLPDKPALASCLNSCIKGEYLACIDDYGDPHYFDRQLKAQIQLSESDLNLFEYKEDDISKLCHLVIRMILFRREDRKKKCSNIK